MVSRHKLNIHITASLLTLIIYFIIVCQGGASFDRSDDAVILSILRGSNGIQASSDGIFISNIIGYILFTLYTITKLIPWYSVLIYFYLVVAFYLSIYVIFESTNGSAARFSLLLCSSLYFYTIAKSVSFTAASLLLSCISCLTMILYVFKGEYAKISPAVICGIFAACAYLLRPSLLSVFLIVFIPTAAYCLLYGTRKVSLAFFAPLMIAILLNSLTVYLHHRQPGVRSYVEYNEARSMFHDTRIAVRDWSFSGIDKSGSGWDFSDYAVARNWWIFDGNVFNATNFAKIVNSSQKFEIVSVDEFKKSWDGVKFHAIFSLCIVLFFVCVDNKCNTLTKLPKKYNYLFLVFLLISMLLLMFIRFPPRVAFPLLLFFTLFFAMTVPRIKEELVKLRYLISTLATFSLLICCYYIYDGIKTNIEYISAEKSYFDACIKNIDLYFDNDTIFVIKSPHRFPDTSSPFTEDNGYGNLKIFPFGWLTASPVYYRFLEENHFRDMLKIVPDMIGNPNIVLLFWDTSGYWNVYKPVFLSHLRRHYMQKGSSLSPIAIREVLDLRVNGYGLLAVQLIGND